MSAAWDRCAACGAGPDAHGLVPAADAVAAIRDAQQANQAMTAAWRREAYSTRIDAAAVLDAWLDSDRNDASALEALVDELLNLPGVPRPADETEETR